MDGAPLPLLPMTSALTLERIRGMEVGPCDIFVASFPKSGTTWMQHIVYQLVSASAGHTGERHISDFAPFLEADRTWGAGGASVAEPAASLHRELGWRAYNTHLLPSMLPAGAARVIYVARAPADVCTSQWHHFAHMAPDDGGFGGELAEFVDAWLAGTLAFGAWRPHVEAWLRAAVTNDRILVVRYEDLVHALPEQVARICAHLGVALDEERLRAHVLPRLGFDWMKRHEARFEPRTVRWVDRGVGAFRFLRNGQVGDAHNHLTAQMLERIEAATAPAVAELAELRC
ncbi:hypothetical protein KFE25_000638 [Diacronema lutheri]|uniref:Sulfotransferase domain-containing protein n=2 Tax=Diacronema lutheri TaxID=2081491 RepID=A0A8J5XRV8_DIALT|nr:hypothetical protein KFE25_000638 [Diacronema lutheri]